MRNLKRNLQKLLYSTYSDKITVYVKDASGNIVYDNIDGEMVPRIKSEQAGYNSPVEFQISCATSGGNSEAMEFGVSVGSYQAVLTTVDTDLPIDEKSLVWKDKLPVFDEDGNIIPDSADYGVLARKPCLNGCKYLLKKHTRGE